MLTDAKIRAAVRAGGNKQLTDGGKRGSGRLLLCLRQGVRPEWYAVTWAGGRKKQRKIGTFPELSLADAREAFKDASFDKPEKLATLGDLITAYVAHLEAQGKRSAPDIHRTLERMATVIGMSRQASEVSTADVVAALRPVYAAKKASMADHMRGAFRAAYGWAIRAQNDYRTASVQVRFGITANPAANIPTEPKKAGERWLSREELLAFWKWLRAGGTRHENRNTDPRNYVALQLLILTGQRVEEVLRIDTSMVNRSMAAIEWPTTKTGNAHVVPATARVLRLLTWCKGCGQGLYFPRAGDASLPVQDSTLRDVVRNYCRQTGADWFCPRDLRRTWKTLAGVAGLSKTERDLIQNHSSGDVSSRHYDRYDYLPEKRAALERWEGWLLSKTNQQSPTP
jgi:integrase